MATTINSIKRWDGSKWVSVVTAQAVTGPTGPTGAAAPTEGDQWFDSFTGKTYTYYGTAWVEIGANIQSPLTTNGDIFYYASGANARLAPGSVGQSLQMDPAGGGLPQWVTGYAVGTAAQRPAVVAGNKGLTWFSTDTLTQSLSDGTGWIIMREPPQSFTPTLGSNITVGNGTFSAWYQRSAGYIDVQWEFTLGSTSSIGATGGNSTWTLPIAAYLTEFNMFNVTYWDTNPGQVYLGETGAGSGSVLQIYYWNTTAAVGPIDLNGPGIINTGPFTWATGDKISMNGRYRMATLYS